MGRIRKLQYINKQWMINVPADLVREKGWKKGAYLAINPKGNYGIEMRKFAESDVPRTSIELESLRLDEITLRSIIEVNRTHMKPEEFAFRLAQHSHVQARIRKVQMRLNRQI